MWNIWLFFSYNLRLFFRKVNEPATNADKISTFATGSYIILHKKYFLFLQIKFHVYRIVIGIGISGIYIFIFCTFHIIWNNKSVQRHGIRLTGYIFHICVAGTVPEIFFFIFGQLIQTKGKMLREFWPRKWVGPGFRFCFLWIVSICLRIAAFVGFIYSFDSADCVSAAFRSWLKSPPQIT